MPERLITTAEVMRRLGCSRTQIHYFRRSGDFPKPIMLGRSVRFRESDLDRWIRERAGVAAQTGEDARHGPAAPAGDFRLLARSGRVSGRT